MSELSERELALMEMAFDEGGSEGYGESRGLFAQGFDAWIADNAARLDKVAPAALTWRDEAPTDVGCYWFAANIDNDPSMTEIWPDADGVLFMSFTDAAVGIPLEEIKGYWSGPIPLPEIGE